MSICYVVWSGGKLLGTYKSLHDAVRIFRRLADPGAVVSVSRIYETRDMRLLGPASDWIRPATLACGCPIMILWTGVHEQDCSILGLDYRPSVT